MHPAQGWRLRNECSRGVIGLRDASRSISERKEIDLGENIALENAAFRAAALLLRTSGTWNAAYTSPRPEVDRSQRRSRFRSSARERQPKCSKAKVKVEHRRRKSMTRSGTSPTGVGCPTGSSMWNLWWSRGDRDQLSSGSGLPVRPPNIAFSVGGRRRSRDANLPFRRWNYPRGVRSSQNESIPDIVRCFWYSWYSPPNEDDVSRSVRFIRQIKSPRPLRAAGTIARGNYNETEQCHDTP